MRYRIPLVTALAGLAACTNMVNETDAATTEAASESDAQGSSSGASASSTSAGPGGSTDASTTASTNSGSSATTNDTTGDDAPTGSTGGPPPVCGDGLVEPPELCDDGNALDHDGCDATCSDDAGATLWFDVYPGVRDDNSSALALTRALDGSIIAVGSERSPTYPIDMMPSVGWMRAYSPEGALLWSRIQDHSPLSDRITAVVTAPNGDLITGGIAHNYNCSDGCFYGQIARHDPAGELIWSTMGDDLGSGFIWSVALADGNIYGVGSTDGWVEPPEMLIMSVSEDGALQWTKTLNPGLENNRGGLSAIAAHPDGAIVVAGMITTFEPGDLPQDSDAWLAELTPEGDLVWAERVDGGEGGHDEAIGLALTDEGDILLTGRVGVDVAIVPDENDILNIEQRDALWLARRAAGGGPMWSTTFDDLSYSSGRSIALHPEHILVAGSGTPEEDDEPRLAYASFTHEGALSWWSATAEGPLTWTNAVLAVDDGSPGGAVYLAGSLNEAWVGRFASAP